MTTVVRVTLVILAIFLLQRLSFAQSQQSLENDENVHPEPLVISREECGDVTRLSSIAIPDWKDASGVREYIDSIIEISRDQDCYDPIDMQVRMLSAVGHDNLALLIDRLILGPETVMSTYGIPAIRNLVKQNDSAVVIERLEMSPVLSRVVEELGWEQHARDRLIAGLHRTDPVPLSWVRMSIRFVEKLSYPAISQKILQLQPHDAMCACIAAEGNIDFPLDEVVDALWERWRNDKYGSAYLAPIAAKRGHSDALSKLLDIADGGTMYVCDGRVWYPIDALRELLDIPASASELSDWLKKHNLDLKYDKASQRYLLSER